MTAVSTGSELSAILLERYPELFFLLHYALPKEAKVQVELYPDTLDSLNLEELLTLYVYGLGEGVYYRLLQPWLRGRSDRRLIFIEDQLGVLQQFFHSQVAPSLFSDSQVIVHYMADPEQIDLTIQELMTQYPCDRVEVLAQSAYQGEFFTQLRLELLRKSTVSHALVTESLQYHKLLTNILPNIHSWQGSFLASGLKGKFKNIPAVICGAGPSLETHFPLLRELSDHMLILAGGSTITALSNHGIIPHLGMAFDPNKEEFERLKNASAYEMPLIYGTRLESNVFSTLNGERGYLISHTGGPCELHFENLLKLPKELISLELGMEALSVTTLLLSLAVEMGCDPILFSGVDLAYSGMQRYSPGVGAFSSVDEKLLEKEVRTSEKHLKRNNIQGHPVSTLVKWVMESDCIASFAAKHPQIRFINVSETALGFKGIPNHSFSKVVKESHWPQLDLHALVHAEIQQLKFPDIKEKIEIEMQQIAASLKRLNQIALDYIEELERIQKMGQIQLFPTAKLTLLGLNFEEEPAFSCFNPLIGPVLDRLLTRVHTLKMGCSEEEKWQLSLHKQLDKFRQWQALIQKQLLLF